MAKKISDGIVNSDVILIEEDEVDYIVTITKKVAIPKEQVMKGEVTRNGVKVAVDPAMCIIDAVKFNLDSALNTQGYREAQEQFSILTGDPVASVKNRIKEAKGRSEI